MRTAVFLVIFFAGDLLFSQNVKFISVTGTSEVIKKADQLKFTVLIRTVDESVEASKIQNDKNLVDLLIILKGAGIQSEDTEIAPISFGKNYEQSDRGVEQKGYYTSITVSFILQDLKKYYDITNKLSANNAFEINAHYALSDYELQHRKVYEDAILSARDKAVYMAEVLNLKPVEVLEIEELPVPDSGVPLNLVTRDTSGGNINGNVSIKRSVRIKFSISR